MLQTRVLPRLLSSRSYRPAALALLCLSALATLVPRGAALPLAPDPVEEFRKSLQEDIGYTDNLKILEEREQELTRRAKDLKSLGDRVRVLLLRGWHIIDHDEIRPPSLLERTDAAIREMVMKQFE